MPCSAWAAPFAIDVVQPAAPREAPAVDPVRPRRHRVRREGEWIAQRFVGVSGRVQQGKPSAPVADRELQQAAARLRGDERARAAALQFDDVHEFSLRRCGAGAARIEMWLPD